MQKWEAVQQNVCSSYKEASSGEESGGTKQCFGRSEKFELLCPSHCMADKCSMPL